MKPFMETRDLLVFQAVPANAFELVLCEQDEKERALWGRDNAAADLSTVMGTAVAVRDRRGLLVALGGVTSFGGTSGVSSPWMLFSPEARNYKAQLLRVVLRCKRALLEESAPAMNFVGKKSSEARSFLSRLGAKFVELPSGDFDLFVFENPHV